MEAFGPKNKKLAVVTAPSAAYLYCMRVFFEDGSLSSAELVRCQCCSATHLPQPHICTACAAFRGAQS